MNYDDFELEDIIRLYASVFTDPALDSERSSLHSALCKKLGVKIEEFEPLTGLTTNIGQKVAEYIIRLSIKELGKK